MTASNWILNLLIWAMLAIGIFFGLRARIRRAQQENATDDAEAANGLESKHGHNGEH